MKGAFLSVLFITILFYSCGTTGHIVFYNFSANKYEVQTQIAKVINKDSAYIAPAKWSGHTTGDYFERLYVYFRNNPEEIYQIGFTGDSTDWKSSATSRLGLICVYQGRQFLYNTDLSNSEKNRIQERLEKEILSKIQYSYRKNN